MKIISAAVFYLRTDLWFENSQVFSSYIEMYWYSFFCFFFSEKSSF